MADFDANVERVFGNFATLDTGAGSIQKQFVYAQDTKQIGVHLLDDSMEWFSSDAKQVLLAGDQTITGKKTFDDTARLNNNIALEIGDGGLLVGNGDGIVLETASAKEFTLNSSGNFHLKVDGVEICQGYANGLYLPRDILLLVGDDTSSGTLSNDGTKTIMDSQGDIQINSDNLIVISIGDMDVLSVSSSKLELKPGVEFESDTVLIDSGGLKIKEGFELTLGGTLLSPPPETFTGYLVVYDKDGTKLQIPAYVEPV